LPITTGFPSGQKAVFPLPLNIKVSLAFITELIKSGHFNPIIELIYPFDGIVVAINHVLSGQKIGNIVVSIE
jgi:NADPH:quinone reductase-like Zn-dependent oxidoreductase